MSLTPVSADQPIKASTLNALIDAANRNMTSQLITTVGSGTFTVIRSPFRVTMCGGGGAAGNNNSGSPIYPGGAGGDSPAAVKVFDLDVGSTVNYTVGGPAATTTFGPSFGATGGSSGTNGSTGGPAGAIGSRGTHNGSYETTARVFGYGIGGVAPGGTGTSGFILVEY